MIFTTIYYKGENEYKHIRDSVRNTNKYFFNGKKVTKHERYIVETILDSAPCDELIITT